MHILQSGEAEKGKIGESVTVTYNVYGASSESEVRAGVGGLIPSSYDGYPLQSITIIDRKGNGKVFEVEANYENKEKTELTKPSWSFSSGSGSIISTVSDFTDVYNLDPNRADWAIPLGTKYYIGYDKDTGEVRGCTIPDIGDSAPLSIQLETKTEPNIAIYYNHKYMVNSAQWGWHPAYSVLYTGTDCSYDPVRRVYAITHNFACGKNQTDLTIGGISGIKKDAFDVLDYCYNEDIDEYRKILRLTNIKRHRVYYNRAFDFGDLLRINPDGSAVSGV